MHPVLFSIGGIDIQAFFFMIMVAALVATFAAVYFAKKEGLSEVAILDMAIIGVIFSMIGARLFHVFFEYPWYYWEKPVRVFYVWQGGFVSLGAFTFSIIALLIYLKRKKLDIARYADIEFLTAPILIFFVRIGCLLTGCCFGKPTDFFIHLKFTNPDSTAYYYYPNISLHATQAYNMLNAVVMAIVLFAIYKRRKFYGQIFASFLIYYGITRFFIEFLRGDADRGLYFGGIFSTGQIMMLISLIAGIILYRYYGKRRMVK